MAPRAKQLSALTLTRCAAIESRILAWTTRHALDALRMTIGVVFVWFGVLKILGLSPAAALVTQTVSAMHVTHGPIVAILGLLETAIGFGLVFGVALRSTLLLFALQQAGTFLVLILCPDVAFQHHNPLLLTMTGEFVIKNVVLVAGGLAVATATIEQHRLLSARVGIGKAVEPNHYDLAQLAPQPPTATAIGAG